MLQDLQQQVGKWSVVPLVRSSIHCVHVVYLPYRVHLHLPNIVIYEPLRSQTRHLKKKKKSYVFVRLRMHKIYWNPDLIRHILSSILSVYVPNSNISHWTNSNFVISNRPYHIIKSSITDLSAITTSLRYTTFITHNICQSRCTHCITLTPPPLHTPTK